MKLNIEIKDREIKYQSASHQGQDLKSLILFLRENSVSDVIISGESKSYTLLRQVAMLVNMLIETKQIKVTLLSKSFSLKENRFLPIYSN
ncbi:MAG: hypothetical protein ABH810_02790 [bacterium]